MFLWHRDPSIVIYRFSGTGDSDVWVYGRNPIVWLCCDHSNETSSTVLSHGTIYLVCSSNFEVCRRNKWCDHSNETSSAVLLQSAWPALGVTGLRLWADSLTARSLNWINRTHDTIITSGREKCLLVLTWRPLVPQACQKLPVQTWLSSERALHWLSQAVSADQLFRPPAPRSVPACCRVLLRHSSVCSGRRV